ncbi:hypothetical protein Pmani_035049 [Petrolisthes manimaculis]|uniref:SCP domain-containing protein n=1 Tax=Petrolisthes manimaculis TaxID=1843537 RepID=A0AAE1TQV0_9EUCA|nr:hypothetical protein Pmani_035049 [Petrolisthes manimaculis]
MASSGTMAHDPDAKYGQNIYCLSSNTNQFKVNPEETVDKWYSESNNHKFGEEPKSGQLNTGHFTQLVWKDTNHFGISQARSRDGTKVFVVANFDPQGNYRGQFADQVPPVGGFKKPTSTRQPPSATSHTKHQSSSSSSSDSEDNEDSFAQDCLKAHNDYRKKHGASPLTLSKKLNQFAKDWADNLAKRDILQHRPSNNSYGENLYVCWSSNNTTTMKGSEAVHSWYSEIKDYTFGREPVNLDAGHFTQVVWLDSKELGVGWSRAKSGKVYVVANYNPAGNFVGRFGTRVPRLK